MLDTYRNEKKILKIGTNYQSASDFLEFPFLDEKFKIPIVGFLDDSEMKLQHLLNPKNLRIYSRSAKWIFESLNTLNLAHEIESIDPFRVGIYCAGPGYATPWEIFKSRFNDNTNITNAVRNHYNPKHHFKYNLGILPAHISIHYQIKGPTNAFLKYPGGGKSALLKASFDLRMNYTDVAVICITNTFETSDQLLYAKYYQKKIGNDAINSESVFSGIFTSYLDIENLLNLEAEETKFDHGYTNFLGNQLP